MLKNLVSTFNIPGYNVPSEVNSENTQDNSKTTVEKSYKIPPVVWMLIFLIVGYVGLSILIDTE